MPQKNLRVCNCKSCRKQRRKGLVLGSRLLTRGWAWGLPLGRDKATYVSDYVPFRRFAKGRRPEVVEMIND